MQSRSYISDISFRFLQPTMPINRPWLIRVNNLLARVGMSVEMLNTHLSGDNREMKRCLHDICRIQKMSTLAIGAIINQEVKRMASDQAFVNVGVWHGFTFLSGLIENPDKLCIGVDNFSQFGGPKEAFLAKFHHYKSAAHYFYDMDYIQYFTEVHKKPIGFYIYDGNHSYEDQLLGLEIAEPFLVNGSILLVDDTNAQEARSGTLDFVAKSKFKYELIFDQSTAGNYHPTFWNGIMVLRRI